jgi:hypothetical protein
MKIHAHFDKDGNIHALIAGDAPKGVALRLSSGPGMQVGDIDRVKVKHAREMDALREIVDTQRIVQDAALNKLAKKG